jgi:hypothetical protein
MGGGGDHGHGHGHPPGPKIDAFKDAFNGFRPPAVSKVHSRLATGLGAFVWFWILYRTRWDGAEVFLVRVTIHTRESKTPPAICYNSCFVKLFSPCFLFVHSIATLFERLVCFKKKSQLTTDQKPGQTPFFAFNDRWTRSLGLSHVRKIQLSLLMVV